LCYSRNAKRHVLTQALHLLGVRMPGLSLDGLPPSFDRTSFETLYAGVQVLTARLNDLEARLEND
jgi:hypothetical protein